MQSALKMEYNKVRNGDNTHNKYRNIVFKVYGDSDYSDNVYIHGSTMSVLDKKSMDDFKRLYLHQSYSLKA